MNLKLLLLLVLVISLIFEIGEAKKRGKGGRKRKRNRKKRMTTTAESATDDPTYTSPVNITQQVNVTQNLTTTTPALVTNSVSGKSQNTEPPQPQDGAVTTSAAFFNSTEEVHHIVNKGLISIIDYLFEYDYVDEETTAALTTTTEAAITITESSNEMKIPLCASLGISRMMTAHLFRGNIPLADLLSISHSDASAAEKLRMTNETLIKYNLPPIKTCIPTKSDNAEVTTATVVRVTTTQLPPSTLPTTTEARAIIATPKAPVEKIPSCASLDITRIMAYHFLNGSIPFVDIMRIRKSRTSAAVKLRMTNETLIKNNLPPLKTCVPAEGSISAPITTKPTATPASTHKMTPANAIGVSIADSGSLSDEIKVETTSTNILATEALAVKPEPAGCDAESIKQTVIGHISTGQLPSSTIHDLTDPELSQAEKLTLLNKALAESGLPLIECGNREIDAQTTSTNILSTESIVVKPQPAGCDAESIKQTVVGYISTGHLPAAIIDDLTNPELCQAEKLILLNKALAEAGLPLIECGEDEIEAETTSTNILSTESIAVKPEPAGCDAESIKQTVVGYISTGHLPAAIIDDLTNPELCQAEKLILLNKALAEAGLPLIECGEDEIEAETTSTNILSTESIAVKPGPAGCEADSIKTTVFGHISTGQLPASTVQDLSDPELSQAEKLTLLNKALADAGLPLIECEKDQESDEQPTMPDCELSVNVSDHGSLLALVREMEAENELPEGTSVKAVEGEVTPHELRGMVVGAAVKSGRLAPECEEGDEPPTPKVLGQVQRLQQLNKLQAIIKAGYLPEDTLTQLALGHITEEWLKANLSKNEDYILSQMPDAIAKLVRSGEMPPEIVAEIFSGSPNKTKIGLMMIQDDKLVKKMLPDNLRAMIGEKPVPMELKLLMISGKNATEIKAEVEEDEDLLQQMMSPSSFFFYSLFKVQMNRDINAAISACVIIVLMFVMTSLGCTMTVSKIAEHAKKPKGVVIALFAQFVIMPASAFGLTQLFQLETYAAIAVLICGCCPGGNLSNMLAYALNGDMNLSILMTSCSSILGLGMMPLSLYLYSQLIVPLDSGDIVPYAKIIFNIACTVVPVGIGIAIRHYRPQWTTYVMRFGAVMLVLCTIVVAVLSGIMLGDAFFLYFDTKVLACCAILPAMGYTFGYLFAFIAREDPKCRRTICVETGCQNVQLCSTVLKLAFDPILVGVLFLMPLVYMAFQTAEACLMVMMFRLYNRCRGHKELVEEEDNSEEKKKLETDSEKGSTSKESAVIEEKKPLTESKDKPESSKETTSKAKDTESDIVELWPLDNTPSPAYLDSFKAAGTENYV